MSGAGSGGNGEPGRTAAAAGVSVPAAAFDAAAQASVDEDLPPAGDGRPTVDPTSAWAGDVGVEVAIVCREEAVVCGMAGLEPVLHAAAARLGMRPSWRLDVHARDGDRVGRPGSVLCTLQGSARIVLAAERPMLNMLGHLSGVATLTDRFVRAVQGSGAVVRDTRKTTPGLRQLEKYAVRCGGGANHRMGLYDALLVKDNHIALAGSLAEAVDRARAGSPDLPLEVEVDSLEQLQEALAVGCDLVLLDNMTAEQTGRAVALAAGIARTEASGRVTLHNVADVAATGVDFIAVGALTHSAPSVDVGLDWRR
ncbi:MAG: carboxylating nicotinate-nucleotide diphosphorylase [Actinomycetota bacterium]|nr:carboxylating nicotinate-nucleotide diphosphorylase [Actinomycetota bacterium]